jgi:hypothetical protein
MLDAMLCSRCSSVTMPALCEKVSTPALAAADNRLAAPRKTPRAGSAISPPMSGGYSSFSWSETQTGSHAMFDIRQNRAA